MVSKEAKQVLVAGVVLAVIVFIIVPNSIIFGIVPGMIIGAGLVMMFMDVL